MSGNISKIIMNSENINEVQVATVGKQRIRFTHTANKIGVIKLYEIAPLEDGTRRL